MKILFMGDSITDAGRNCTNGSCKSIGQGYAMLVSAKLGKEFPQKYSFVNTGISGNRIVDIYQRVKCDFWNLKPDVFSLLIGVNDIWHEVESQNGVEPERFENVYRMLLSDSLKVLPKLKIILMEPFVLKGLATEENWETFKEGTKIRAEIVRKISKEFGTGFVELQNKFNEAEKLTNDASYWLADGVHPTPAGHAVIAEEWLKVFNKLQ